MKTSRGIRIEDLPPALQAQARAQLERIPNLSNESAVLLGSLALKAQQKSSPTPNLDKMIRQSTEKLNNTEERFLEWLKSPPRCYTHVFSQEITLKIGNGVRYTPDAITFDQYFPEEDEDGRSNLFEIKAWEV